SCRSWSRRRSCLPRACSSSPHSRSSVSALPRRPRRGGTCSRTPARCSPGSHGPRSVPASPWEPPPWGCSCCPTACATGSTRAASKGGTFAAMSESVSGTLLLPEGPVPGTIRFGRTITAIERGGDVPDRIIAPGFIDAHVHGGGGGDTMDGPGGVRTLAAFHSSRGTTTILPTTITNPFADVVRVLEGVRAVRADGDPALPDIPGAHLEGPFISRERLGAQPDFALPPEPELISRVLETQAVSVVTIAPELPGA